MCYMCLCPMSRFEVGPHFHFYLRKRFITKRNQRRYNDIRLFVLKFFSQPHTHKARAPIALDTMATRAMRSLFSVAAMLVANEVRAFVSPAGLTSLPSRTSSTSASTSLDRSARRWNQKRQMDAGSGEAGSPSDQVQEHLIPTFGVEV